MTEQPPAPPAPAARVLVLGYGNPGRLDDGLGPALAEAIESLHLPGVDVDADYQLTVEDASAVAEHDVVVFADAAEAGDEPFFFRAVAPAGGAGFTSHGCRPGGVMALAGELFQAAAKGYILGIRGYEFNEFGEALSDRARRNLAAAAAFLRQVLVTRSFDQAVRRLGQGPDGDADIAKNAGCNKDAKEEPSCKTENT
jgi:hydrogenase maturation protease